ncbi:DUF5710 domain-containing protein [Streptomyces sp. UNOC14_S4]|uniref:DUF5710 domain-containing protein n=1 Tax=Streptomyces sp. UNOC14_S4 TaxID=2872340 RepID=UPI001E3EB9F2|nr:DUF5710 domain-containing protein [Streptomyces sp. UNOC14_S4]
MVDRIWLDVPYSQKDEAKAAGARWDPAAGERLRRMITRRVRRRRGDAGLGGPHHDVMNHVGT